MGGINSTRLGKGGIIVWQKWAKLRGLIPKKYFINIPKNIKYREWTFYIS